ncbi:peptidoglycan-binding protein [Streptomyces sp. NPDC093984]|uniref:peptidoglycan-binding domain-containing protein n=1 Tax=Streptomyces sp. NPDC093984 TaxID=3366052 RepID=UPI0037F2257B
MQRLKARIGTLLGATALLIGSALAIPSQADASTGVITYGSTNHHGVWCVQRIINRLGIYHHLTEDGIFGNDTEKGVETFQIWWDEHYWNLWILTRDGIVGRATGSALLAAINGDSYCEQYLP